MLQASSSRPLPLRKSAQSNSSRIPETLQAVFIVSNRGREVSKPPPDHVASRTFNRRASLGKAMMRRRSSSASNTSATEGSSSMSPERQRKSLQPIPMDTLPTGENFISPEAYVTSTMRNRGYHANTYSATKTAYHNKPTSIQTASYGKFLVKAVRENDTDTLRELFSLGLSPNACNTHGESIVHTACRLGKLASLQVMLEYGASVSVCDDYGRTPMHDACWQNEHPQFGIVEVLLQHDAHLLFIMDARGSSPMSYIPRDRWNEWTRFFMSKKDKFWPERNWEKEGFKPDPERTQEEPNTRPIHATVDVGLTPDILQMIAEGSMDCSGLIRASSKAERRGSATTLTWDDDDDDESDDDSFSSDYSYDSDDDDLDDDDDEDEDDTSTCTFDEDEMNAILNSIGSSRPVRWSSNSFDLPKEFLEEEV